MALLGVTEGPGTIGMIGRTARHASALAAAIEGIHMVAVDPDVAEWPPAAGVSRMMALPGLPLYSQSLRGVAVDGHLGSPWIREAARVVARLGRVVVVRAQDEASAVLENAGLGILAAEADIVVAGRG